MEIKIPEKYAPDAEFDELLLKCGNVFARGQNRDVYLIPDHDDKVLKVSNGPGNFSNWCEIIAYAKKGESGDLAELYAWSWSGKFIVMEKLQSVTIGEFNSHKFPEYLTDRKLTNYGRDLSGKIKALDYGDLKFSNHYSSPFE